MSPDIIEMLKAARQAPRRAAADRNLIEALRNQGHTIVEHRAPMLNKYVLACFGYLIPKTTTQVIYEKFLLWFLGFPIAAIALASTAIAVVWYVIAAVLFILALPQLVASALTIAVVCGITIALVLSIYLPIRWLYGKGRRFF